jgi:CheY-like chemotaxis protein
MTIPKELIVLIADDDDGHATLIQEQLEDVGLHNAIYRFRDGVEVWAFLSGEQGAVNRAVGNMAVFDATQAYLLLLDIRMPKMDGVEVLRRVKETPSLHKLPVIMLTTTDDPREVAECYALGCNSYITKPVIFDEFSEVIKRLGLFVSVMAVAPLQAEKGGATV